MGEPCLDVMTLATGPKWVCEVEGVSRSYSVPGTPAHVPSGC
jgi:hypothetical protein